MNKETEKEYEFIRLRNEILAQSRDLDATGDDLKEVAEKYRNIAIEAETIEELKDINAKIGSEYYKAIIGSREKLYRWHHHIFFYAIFLVGTILSIITAGVCYFSIFPDNAAEVLVLILCDVLLFNIMRSMLNDIENSET